MRDTELSRMSWVWLVVPEILTMNFLLKHIHLALQERLENEIEASIVVFLVFCFIYLRTFPFFLLSPCVLLGLFERGTN